MSNTVDDRPAGGHAVVEAVYRQQYDAVLRFLQRRVDNEQDAAELAQEAYLRALRYHDRDHDSLKAILFRIATNLARAHARRDRTHRTNDHVPLDDLSIASNDPPQDERLAREQHLDMIVAAVHELPDRCRQVFVLSRFHGMRHKEVARRCGISVSMVEKHLTKGLALVRAKVGETD